MKVIFCTPTRRKPHPAHLDALEASVPALDAAGIEYAMVQEIACPYVSAARATMLRKALDAKADAVVFIDDDVSWEPRDLVTLIQAPGDVVAGVYRFKVEPEDYMGALDDDGHGRPFGRLANGVLMLRATRVPAGFLKVTTAAVDRFMSAYPELCYGPKHNPSVDLFNHGAHAGVWWGEDYAFCRRWIDAGGEVWLLPDLNLTHHDPDRAFPGNFHEYLQRLPGGAKAPPPPKPDQEPAWPVPTSFPNPPASGARWRAGAPSASARPTPAGPGTKPKAARSPAPA